MALAQLETCTLGFSDVGEPDSRTTVLLGHGFFLDKSMWSGVAEALAARGYRVITWDAPGHGDSPAPDQPFTYWDLADASLRLLDHLGVQRAHVGGLSQGGFIALRTALAAPERVTGLILADTQAHALDDAEERAYTELFGALDEHGPVDDVLIPLSQQLIGDAPEARIWLDRWKRSALPLGTPVRALLGRDDITGRLGEISCPTLLIRGSDDASIPAERMALLSREIPQATSVREVAGATHAPPISHPGHVTRIVLDWLSDVDGSA